MSTEKLLGEDLVALQNEKGNICVSVIVPAHRLSPERRTDVTEVKKAIEKAGQLLQYKYGEKEVEPLVQTMHGLYKTIDFTHNLDGIGLYVSPHFKLSVKFPFPVEEKVMAGDSFEIRDLLYKINYSIPYYVLVLTEKHIRLFEGSWDELAEIKDKNFPVDYKDDFEYAKPVHSAHYAGYSQVKGFEKDKSELETIRFRDFFREVDKLLDNYLVNDTPLLLTGVERELSLFGGITGHARKIAGKITRSFNYSHEKELADIAWPAMYQYFKNEREKLVKEFAEKIGEGLAVTGIQDIWSAAQEGRALKLLVEKDYRCPGFLTGEGYRLHLFPPESPHKVLPDAVDALIVAVLEKSGHVFFVDNGTLKDYDRIALITRY
ncbi:MAG: hypothetical protein Q8941_02400 [Bacteroidota bacterium]|nr:hypothetical protein [Bacteroidota bacterium]